MPDHQLAIFSTCPQSRDSSAEVYARSVAEVARWSEAAGCEGILIYTDNGLVDPVAGGADRSFRARAPGAARGAPGRVHASVHRCEHGRNAGPHYGRRLYLNLVAGGSGTTCSPSSDTTPHDERYERTVSIARILKRLLAGETVTSSGSYYSVTNLRITAALPSNSNRAS